MVFEITRRLEFDAGHRVLRHESKCAHLHGHRYVVEVTVEAPHLDDVGRVIDFGEVKKIIGGWIDEHWDHNTILHPEDPLLAVAKIPHQGMEWPGYKIFAGKAPYVMPVGTNPTAENLVVELYNQAKGLLTPPLKIVKVRIRETPNCWATYSPEK